MNTKIITAVVTLVAVIGFAMPIAVFDESSAASEITVTDGFGNTLTLDKPTNKIMTIGVGATATAIEVGALDKIVVCDKYSKTNASSLFDGLRANIDAGKCAANGSIYSSSAIISDAIYAAREGGSFDKEKDVFVICASDTYRVKIVPYLQEKGFKNILQWDEIKEYSEIIGFVKAVSMVCRGSIVDAIDKMEYIPKLIKDEFEASGLKKTKAFFVTYSGGDYKVGNTGSLANSMILAACGDSVTVDDAYTTSTYTVGTNGLAELIAEHGDGVVIFLDNSIASDDEKVNAVKTATKNKAKLVGLDPLWNNYCIESVTGLWTMASAMYPDLFSGDVPEVPNDEGNSVIFIIAGVIGVAAIALVAILFFKK